MSRSCNNNYYNPCNNASAFNNSWLYTLIIFFIFGGGFGPGSFWSDYNKVFGCSGFSNGWCNNIGSNNSNNGNFNIGNYGNNNFNSPNLSNSNFSNSDFAGLLSNLSGNGNLDIGNLTDDSI